MDHFLLVISAPPSLSSFLQLELTRGRQIDRGNAQSASLGADFGRFMPSFWKDLQTYDAGSLTWKKDLDALNDWRNAIVHQDFTSPKLGGIMKLRIRQVRSWRRSCARLAKSMDAVIRIHLQHLTGTAPW